MQDGMDNRLQGCLAGMQGSSPFQTMTAQARAWQVIPETPEHPCIPANDRSQSGKRPTQRVSLPQIRNASAARGRPVARGGGVVPALAFAPERVGSAVSARLAAGNTAVTWRVQRVGARLRE
jgi:hypothetical protein